MLKIFFVSALTFCSFCTKAQSKLYKDSIQQYLNNYVAKHEVVTGEDKKLMQFFPVDKHYRVTANFERIENAKWFNINTSSGRTKSYRHYGKITFTIHQSKQTLYIYQAQSLLQNPKYWDHLFLPFMDATNGKETYETGRYLDLKLGDVKANKIIIDFNKVYNPYCAYVSDKYNCPVPPKENRLQIEIRAGEKKFH